MVRYRVRCPVPHRLARIPDDHREIALLDPRLGDGEMNGGVVGNVLLGEIRAAPVRGHVCAQEGEIARVARPHPVVDVAAVVADREWRRVDDAHVLDREIGEELVDHPVVEGLDAALDVPVLLRLADDLLRALLDRLVPLEIGHLVRDGVQHLLRDIVDIEEDVAPVTGGGDLPL